MITKAQVIKTLTSHLNILKGIGRTCVTKKGATDRRALRAALLYVNVNYAYCFNTHKDSSIAGLATQTINFYNLLVGCAQPTKS